MVYLYFFLYFYQLKTYGQTGTLLSTLLKLYKEILKNPCPALNAAGTCYNNTIVKLQIQTKIISVNALSVLTHRIIPSQHNIK